MHLNIKKPSKLFLLLISMLTILILTSCSNDDKNETDKLLIVTTLFPQYDFASQIVGEKAEVVLLLNPGTEAHDYDPTPSDMIKINNSDLFIYTGKYMEAWADNILKSIDNKELKILDISNGIKLYASEGEHEHEANLDVHEYDPHIWTSPKNAVIMINNILNAIIEIDAENEKYYRENANKYIAQIEDIDGEIKDVVEHSKYDTIYFGGRFALLYFVKEYNLKYVSAFDSCSTETEPSTKLVKKIVDEMIDNGAKVVFYEELTDPKTAKAIANEIGGRVLLLHSCHNVSADDFKNGATYVSIMKKNIENIKIGLNYSEKVD